jgi:(p)ppGpp synthase/HD superfamily hydrolase
MIDMDTSLMDKALIFAVRAHSGTARTGTDIPYIVHPAEAVSIAAAMTSDQEILAAAALHDVAEDTKYTFYDIEKEFGKRVADLVAGESEIVPEGVSQEDTWVQRRKDAIDHIRAQNTDGKIVALSDKLSNMRAIYRDYMTLGDELWNRFHVNDKNLHEWHYRGLADALSELSDRDAYKEFVMLIDLVFEKNKQP